MKATATRSLIAVVAMGVLTGLLLPGVVAGQEAVSILGMAWTPKPAPALVISASGPLTFTKAQPEPGVLIVEFPEAALAKPLPAVEEPAAGLRRASVSAVEEGGKHWVRLRVEIDMNASVSVSALPSGIEVRVAQAQELSRAPRAGELGDVLAVADATGVSVHLAGQGSFESKAFTLENPPRIVVDLKGVVNRLARRVQPVGAAGVERVRVAQFATAPEPVVRVVVDLDKPLPYHIEPTADGALLRVGGEQAQVAEAPAAAAPAAVQVAEAPAVAKPEPEPTKAEPVAAKAEPEPTKAEPAAAKAESVAAKAESETPAAAPVTAKAETPAAPVTPAAEQAAAIPQTPVKIVDEPPPAVQPQPKAAPAEAPPSGSLTTPPAAPAGPAHKASPADSPWTTTPAAMAEQAAPPTAVATGSHELESQEKRFTGEPISLELKDADIKDVLRTFAKITGLNVVVDPGVSGSVTVNLENVPWDQCLDIILRVNGLDYVVENNVLRVARIQQLTAEKSQQAMLRKESENAKPMRTVAKTLSYAKASAVKAVLTSQGFILSDRGSVVVDDRTNQLIIRDATDKL